MTFIGELLGTFILVLLGDGVVSACVLNKTKAQNSGWIAIVLGWGIAVTVAVYVSGFMSGAHLNPAVTLAMAAIGSLPWSQVVTYLLAQFLGAMLGALVLYWHRSEEHTSELQSRQYLVCRLLLEKKKKQTSQIQSR